MIPKIFIFSKFQKAPASTSTIEGFKRLEVGIGQNGNGKESNEKKSRVLGESQTFGNLLGYSLNRLWLIQRFNYQVDYWCDVRFYCLYVKTRLTTDFSVRNLNSPAFRACYGYEKRFHYLAHTRRTCYAVLWFSSYCCLLNQDGYLCQSIRIPRFGVLQNHSQNFYSTINNSSSKIFLYSVISDFHVFQPDKYKCLCHHLITQVQSLLCIYFLCICYYKRCVTSI